MSMMNKLNGALEKYFLPVAMKISGNIYLQAIRDGLTLTMPLKYFLNLWIFTYTWISRAYDKNIW